MTEMNEFDDPNVGGIAAIEKPIPKNFISAAGKIKLCHAWKQRMRSEYQSYFQLPATMNNEELWQHWLKFLLDMAIEYCITQNPMVKHVYASERLRFFSEFNSWSEKKRFYEEILYKDSLDIIDVTPDIYRDLVRGRLEQLHRSIYSPKQYQFKLLMVGDCIFDEVMANLHECCSSESISIDVKRLYLGAFSEENFDGSTVDAINTGVDKKDVDAIAFSFFTYWGIPQFRALLEGVAKECLSDDEVESYLDSVHDYVDMLIGSVRSNSTTTIFLHNASGIPWLLGSRYVNNLIWKMDIEQVPNAWEELISEINSRIEEISRRYSNVIMIDERKAVASLGRDICRCYLLPPRLCEGSIFHHFVFGYQLAEEYLFHISAMTKLKKTKAILVDFDNTLWDGVMAEGMVKHHWNRQKILKNLVQEGLILVALSKNDQKHIRWSELVLAKSDFAAVEIGWENKVELIEKLSEDLSLSLDAFVFIDDCERQRGLVNHYYPQVTTLDGNDENVWQKLQVLHFMDNTSNTEEATGRSKLYLQNARRKREVKAGASQVHGLHPLDIRIEMTPADQLDVERIHELIHRTNQFNCTGSSYSKDELRAMVNSPIWDLWTYRLTDKFGDMGCVGVVILSKRLATSSLMFDTFVMSCRAMGYGVEHFMVTSVVQRYPGWTFTALYRQTAKNGPCKNLYASMAFRSHDGQLWQLDDPARLPNSPSWINQ